VQCAYQIVESPNIISGITPGNPDKKRGLYVVLFQAFRAVLPNRKRPKSKFYDFTDCRLRCM